MSKPSVLISLETNHTTERKEFGRAFIQRLIDEDARLIPELLSTTERYKDPFLSIDDMIDRWWAMPIATYFDGRPTGERIGGPLWKRKTTLASRGMVTHNSVNIKNQKLPSSLWFESRWTDAVDFMHLFTEWARLSKPIIGMLHVFTDAEKPSLQYAAGSSFAVGSFGGPAKPGIPNIGWAMAYGEEYAMEVDVRAICAAGFPVDHIDGAVIVRVTESVSDVVNDFALFTRRREELKRLFRPGLFWIENETSLSSAV